MRVWLSRHTPGQSVERQAVLHSLLSRAEHATSGDTANHCGRLGCLLCIKVLFRDLTGSSHSVCVVAAANCESPGKPPRTVRVCGASSMQASTLKPPCGIVLASALVLICTHKTASGLQGKEPLVIGQNATAGSRQIGRVSSEEALAPQAEQLSVWAGRPAVLCSPQPAGGRPQQSCLRGDGHCGTAACKGNPTV